MGAVKGKGRERRKKRPKLLGQAKVIKRWGFKSSDVDSQGMMVCSWYDDELACPIKPKPEQDGSVAIQQAIICYKERKV